VVPGSESGRVSCGPPLQPDIRQGGASSDDEAGQEEGGGQGHNFFGKKVGSMQLTDPNALGGSSESSTQEGKAVRESFLFSERGTKARPSSEETMAPVTHSPVPILGIV